jgi:cell division septum initiation protein DivIVA
VTVGDQGAEPPDAETLVRRAVEVINNGKSVPLSTSVLISNKDEVVDLLDAAIERLPEEIRQARFLLRERQEHLVRVQREAEEILDAARARAERMVQRTEIVREAQHNAQRLIDESRERAARLRHEAEEYCDKRLAAFEIVLERTMRSVQAGREKLQATAPLPAEHEPSDLLGERSAPAAGAGAGGEFFDQDRS